MLERATFVPSEFVFDAVEMFLLNCKPPHPILEQKHDSATVV